MVPQTDTADFEELEKEWNRQGTPNTLAICSKVVELVEPRRMALCMELSSRPMRCANSRMVIFLLSHKVLIISKLAIKIRMFNIH